MAKRIYPTYEKVVIEFTTEKEAVAFDNVVKTFTEMTDILKTLIQKETNLFEEDVLDTINCRMDTVIARKVSLFPTNILTLVNTYRKELCRICGADNIIVEEGEGALICLNIQ